MAAARRGLLENGPGTVRYWMRDWQNRLLQESRVTIWSVQP